MATVAEQMQKMGSKVFSTGSAMPTVPAMPTASGGLMATNAMQAPKAPPAPPSYDDSTSSNLARITSQDSPLMKIAAASGAAQANRRGLLNSSIAVGASQAETIKAATPIAAADAQVNAQKNLQNMDSAAQMQRLQINNDAEMARLERQLGNANEQQRVDIEAQMARLTATNAAEMARLQEQGRITGGLNAQQATAEMERLRTQLASAEGQQRTAIAGEMARLERQIGGQSALSAQESQQQRALSAQQAAAEMERLRTQLNSAEGQQRAAIEAEMARLIETQKGQQTLAGQQFNYQANLQQQQYGQTSALNDQAARAELAKLERQLAGADAQQAREITAQMDRLRENARNERELSSQNYGQTSALQDQAARADFDKMRIQAEIDRASAGTAAENQRALTALQGSIQSSLQAQGNAEQMQRMAAQFNQDILTQDRAVQGDLAKIAASGDQDVRKTLVQAQEARQDLAMQLAAGDRERVAQAAVQIFAAEAQIRSNLLANQNMPAGERAAYEQAISSLGNPVRAFINQLFSTPPAGGAAPAPAGLMPTAAPIAGVNLLPGAATDTVMPDRGGLLVPSSPIYNANNGPNAPTGPLTIAATEAPYPVNYTPTVDPEVYERMRERIEL